VKREGSSTYRNAVSVLLANALGLCLALLERVLVLELGAHVVDEDGCRSDVRAYRRCGVAGRNVLSGDSLDFVSESDV
jgi:hypothetical protein